MPTFLPVRSFFSKKEAVLIGAAEHAVIITSKDSPSMMQERERRRANVSTISGNLRRVLSWKLRSAVKKGG
jgi:hypothetical protein